MYDPLQGIIKSAAEDRSFKGSRDLKPKGQVLKFKENRNPYA